MRHRTKPKLYHVIALLFATQNLYADTGIDDQTLTQTFTIQATIIKGCLLGTGSTDVSSFGTINFGTISSLNQSKDVTSSANAGSISIKCTPNTTIKIALNSGVNNTGAMASGRLLKNTSTSETLLYQLFQDANYSAIWGNDSNGGSSKSVAANGTIQSFPIYARLFSATTLPSAGIYTDVITVTITY